MRSFPFTAQVYYSLFETYNLAIWPAQLVAYVLGIALVILALRPVATGGRIALLVLALFWLWIGIAYHVLYFVQINFAALAFGPLFALQGLLCAAAAFGRRRGFAFRADPVGWLGLAFMLFALLIYPLLGWLGGHGWPQAAMFGVAPAPTVIFTFGALLLLEAVPLYWAALPLLWTLAAGSAAVLRLETPEDLSLPVAGLVGFALLVWKKRP